jgi:hypothetical protein
MFWAKVTHPSLGTMRRRWGKWRGQVRINGSGSDVEVVIELPKGGTLRPFQDRIGRVVTNFAHFRQDLAAQAYVDYQFFRNIDIEAGLFTEEVFKTYPSVAGPADVWRALKPYRLWHGGAIDRYSGNAYLVVNVDWPNPHFFQVCFQLNYNICEHMSTELVG